MAVLIVPAFRDSRDQFFRLSPGVLLSGTVAAAASFLGAHYATPVMLLALLLGMAFNFLYAETSCRAGVDFSARFLLRLGVGLLGVRIVVDDLVQIGPGGAVSIIGLIAATIAVGFVVTPLLRQRWSFAILTGGAVAICGASAALAIAAVIPAGKRAEQNTLFTVMSVTVLSTVAMVAYPLLFRALGFSDLQQGFLIGATIHDVAQVVGAGFSVSDAAGEIATIVKLFRVAMLPVVLAIILLVMRTTGTGTMIEKIPLLPWFLMMFLALVIAGSVLSIPETLKEYLELLSRICLIVAIAALGIKTSLRTLSEVGLAPLVIVLIETLALLGVAIMVVGFLIVL